ncbi:GNAT family N-acetyltransferase [Streptomyces diastaticus]|uniref:GNAT family N-acetyltransferase n=1 Tax=Streptomyces diastaticus TaxID=1956 RepID=UPI0035D9AA94
MPPADTTPHGPATPTARARPGVPGPAPAPGAQGAAAGPPGSHGTGAAEGAVPGTAGSGGGLAPAGPGVPAAVPATGPAGSRHGDGGLLLDRVGRWASETTPFGIFRLVPLTRADDLTLLTTWMNDPAVAAFWELAGPPGTTARHVRAQLAGDGRSVPCLGLLDGRPMSYWELYRADLDPLARHYPARPHDTGVHLLLGGAADRGRGVGTALLRAVVCLVLAHRPRCGRVLAEPDVRNAPSVAAFRRAGFRLDTEVDLPGKRAALMVRERTTPTKRAPVNR